MICGETHLRNEIYNKNFSEENFYKKLIETEKPVIIDIGAHTGESVDFFSKIFPNAKIYSVEPDPESYQKLVNNVASNVTTFNAAVGSSNKTLSFYQYDKSHLNSLYPINKDSQDSLGYAESCIEKKIDVSCITLDSLVDKLDLTDIKIDLLKIDVQGAELDIFSSGQNALKKINNITLELNLFDFYEKKNNFLSLETLLHGFELYAITKLSQNPKNFRTDWVEVFYKSLT
jgi:FkbM family methyltransferase